MTTEITAVSVRSTEGAEFIIEGINLPTFQVGETITATTGAAAIYITESSISLLSFELEGPQGPPTEAFWQLPNGLTLEHLGLLPTPAISFSGLHVQFNGRG